MNMPGLLSKDAIDRVKIYFSLIPFLHPRGFDEYISAYKYFFTAWLYLVVVYWVYLSLKKYSQNNMVFTKFDVAIIVYYLTLFSITFIDRLSFSDCLQKLFAAPVFCLICVDLCRNNSKKFIICANNIFIIEFILGTVIFNSVFYSYYFKPALNHLTFLGHVNICAQMGVTAILFAYCEYYFYGNKIKLISQIILSIIIMVGSVTNASYLAVILLVIFFVFNKLKMRNIITKYSYMYIWIYLLLNIILFGIIMGGKLSINLGGFSLNGRGFIWREAIKNYLNNPIFGYGAHGTYIVVFWSKWTDNGSGMNYMHNQILQILNDGGIILGIVFMILLLVLFGQIKKIKSLNLRFWTCTVMNIMLVVMIFESPMEYIVVFMLFELIANMYKMEQLGRKYYD